MPAASAHPSTTAGGYRANMLGGSIVNPLKEIITHVPPLCPVSPPPRPRVSASSPSCLRAYVPLSPSVSLCLPLPERLKPLL